ncbi:MAG: MFS transporter, partial [Rhodospirillaceae bacterium]|nr:MFS transporter [Rhodospirillaceae bacterium]
MPKLVPLKTDVPWFRVEATDADWKKEDPVVLAQLLEQLFIVRKFEERLLELFKAGCIHGPAHASIGQEGGAIAAISKLGAGDKINGTHRAHHQFVSRFLFHEMPEGYDPREGDFPARMQDAIYRSMAEIMGLSPGYCGGRGGSMHMRRDEAGVLGTNAIVGGNPPQATGYALADKLLGTGNVTVTFFGDGAMQNGAAYESMNMAALYDLPMVFMVENNLYGVSTHVSDATRETRLSARGQGLAVPSLEVDGMNAMAMRKAMDWALKQIREDKGPVLIESLTYRFFHQHGPMRGSAFGYREKAEEQAWRERDPFKTLPEKCLALGVIDKKGLKRLEQRTDESVRAAAEALTENEPESNQLRVIPSLWPDIATVEHGIRGDLSELAGQRMMEASDIARARAEKMTFIEAISAAQLHAMERDEKVVVIGEDVHRLNGGTVGATRGILECFPDRLIATPIAENGFTGMGLGAAINGLRPIVEIMYADFCLVAADQLFNQIAKVRHMFGGESPVPIIVRVRVAGGHGYGSQHSMDPSGVFAMWPGWRVISPTTPFDYIGMFNSAVLCDDPVAIIECQTLYQEEGLVPADDLDYCIPFGSARTVRPGTACTVIACGNMVPICLQAAEKSGIDAEIIDPRSLDPLDMDWRTIGASVERTNRLLVAEQTARGPSLGGRIAQEGQERLFDWLDHPILRVSGTQSAPVVSKVL